MKLLNTQNKPNLRDRLRKLSGGVTAHLSSPLVLQGVTWKPSDLAGLFQSLADALDAADSQRAKWHEQVVSAATLGAKVRPVAQALETWLLSQFAPGSSVLDDFGVVRKPRKVSSATKASAAQKAKATRQKNGTKGTRQKKAAKKLLDVTVPQQTSQKLA